MNAMEFVQAAKDWKNVPKQLICTTVFPTFTKRYNYFDNYTAKSHKIIKFLIKITFPCHLLGLLATLMALRLLFEQMLAKAKIMKSIIWNMFNSSST